MTMDVHSHVDAVLKYAQRLQALMDEQLDKMAGESFTATDEAETVEVTLNGHHRLVDVFIEDGLLRLGADVVAERINEALDRAGARAVASLAADRERMGITVTEMVRELRAVTS